MKKYLTLLCCLLITSCVYTPHLITVYDQECRIKMNHMELKSHEVISLNQCSNEECIAGVLGASVISAGSAIISGSIVVSANLVYWFEKQAKCH
jgi:hypothetical protein